VKSRVQAMVIELRNADLELRFRGNGRICAANGRDADLCAILLSIHAPKIFKGLV